MNRSLHFLGVLICMSMTGWSRGAPNRLPATASPPHLPAKDKVVVYSGAAVIDGTGGPVRLDMAIITRGERIDAIVPQAELRLPPGAEVVDVKGQYALPGFINSHEHLATPPNRKFAEAMMRRDLYGGVTAARCMGDDLRALAELARASRLAEIPGPDLYYAAVFAGPDFLQDPRLIACRQGTTGVTPWIQAIDDKTDLANAVTLAKGAPSRSRFTPICRHRSSRKSSRKRTGRGCKPGRTAWSSPPRRVK